MANGLITDALQVVRQEHAKASLGVVLPPSVAVGNCARKQAIGLVRQGIAEERASRASGWTRNTDADVKLIKTSTQLPQERVRNGVAPGAPSGAAAAGDSEDAPLKRGDQVRLHGVFPEREHVQRKLSNARRRPSCRLYLRPRRRFRRSHSPA